MPHPRYEAEEVVERGEQIFEQYIRPLVAQEDPRKLVAIDIESRDYALGTDQLEVADQLLAKHPEAEIYLTRVGFRAVGTLGGGSLDPRTDTAAQ